MKIIITIDGPTASGKSTVAQLLAQRLGFYYLNTGLLYRACAYALEKDYGFAVHLHCIDPMFNRDDLQKIVDELSYAYEVNKTFVYYRGTDITPCLGTDEIGQLASRISASKQVREVLLSMQRRIAHQHDIVVDGRDCGSVVFPQAAVKFFLTASLECRARRLMKDHARYPVDTLLKQIKADIHERDERDKNREVAPLRIPDNAMIIDNTELTVEQTVVAMLQKIDP